MSHNDELYYSVAEILRKVFAMEQSLRTAVYASSYKNKKSLLKLSCETIKFLEVFDEVLKDPSLKEVRTDVLVKDNINLLYVLLYEFLAGPGLSRASPKLKAVVMRKGKEIKDKEKLLQGEGKGIAAVRAKQNYKSTTDICIPRYARINTLKWTREEALKFLREDKWMITEVTPENFMQSVSRIREDEVILDPHVKDLLIFPVLDNFYSYWIVNDKYLILQDKASCLPAFLLDPPEGSEIVDACAAPGMKTSHLAALINNKGKIYAYDRAEDRVETMEYLMERSGIKCAQARHQDFLKVNVRDKQYSNVEYALVDPPCSGSGIVKRMDELTGGNNEKARLDKLQNLQAMILKHALKLPNLKRAVYSTCSIHEEENEQVVDEVLRDTYVRQNFVLDQQVLPSWKYRGLDKYPEVGEFCLRANPKETLTNGFFVAVFNRIERETVEEEQIDQQQPESSKKEEKQKNKQKREKPEKKKFERVEKVEHFEPEEEEPWDLPEEDDEMVEITDDDDSEDED